MNQLFATSTKPDFCAARRLATGLFAAAVVGVVCGASSWLFLGLLDAATSMRTHNDVLVYSLPFAGFAIGWFYQEYGDSIKAGTNLLIKTTLEGGGTVPLRMAPMVLGGTVLTHLFGGSAGREGTAVQIGGSLGDWIAHRFGVDSVTRKHLLMAGIAGGFGAVFGTPLAGALFAVEFLVPGRVQLTAFIPALIASAVGDWVVRFLGAHHADHPQVPLLSLTPSLAIKWVIVAVAIALVAVVFIELTHLIKARSEKHIKALRVRMFVGGALVVCLWKLIGTSDYLGLGVPMILRAFSDSNYPTYAFALKLLMTAVTLGFGFLGGEVTPLFFVGVGLGSVLARALGIPIEIGAGVGLAAMFGAASNAPLALTVMATELMGSGIFMHSLVVCVIAYVLTGRRSIYAAQPLAHKTALPFMKNATVA